MIWFTYNHYRILSFLWNIELWLIQATSLKGHSSNDRNIEHTYYNCLLNAPWHVMMNHMSLVTCFSSCGNTWWAQANLDKLSHSKYCPLISSISVLFLSQSSTCSAIQCRAHLTALEHSTGLLVAGEATGFVYVTVEQVVAGLRPWRSRSHRSTWWVRSKGGSSGQSSHHARLVGQSCSRTRLLLFQFPLVHTGPVCTHNTTYHFTPPTCEKDKAASA